MESRFSCTRFAFLLSALASIGGCSSGSSSGSSFPAAPAPSFSEPPSLVTFENLSLKRLECADPKGCPSAIGELVVATPNGPSFCTATLVAPDLVLTAYHCAPWASARPDHSLTGNCWVRFPSDFDVGGDKVACSAIVSASSYSPTDSTKVQSDWAYLRLAKPFYRRSTMQVINDDSLPRERKSGVILYGISLTSGRHILNREVCKRDDATTLPERAPLLGDTIILPDCHIEPGYSGGPVLEPLTGGIVGVISFMKTKPDRGSAGLGVGTDVPAVPQ